MIEKNNRKLSVSRQCGLLGISRSSLYYKRGGKRRNSDIVLENRILEIFWECPSYGYRKIQDDLRKKGCRAGTERVRNAMKRLGIKAIMPKRNLSIPAKGHKKYPYLLRGVKASAVNHVWASDITYVRIGGGYMYLVAIIDHYSRKILSWRVSNTLDTRFCEDTLNEALVKYGKPEIFNTDQGSQFTSEAFTGILERAQVKISMDGKGRAIDNVYIERVWRSLKYEDIYIRDYQTARELKSGINRYFEFYNLRRSHQSLGYKTPNEVYYAGSQVEKAG